MTTKRGKENVVTVVREKSKLITLEEVARTGTLTKPDKGTVALAGRHPPPAAVPRSGLPGDLRR